MFNTAEELRKVALSITHYAYRNTDIEDYHSQCVKMDKNFYKKIYNIVYRKLKNVCALHKYVESYPYSCESKEDIEKLMQTVPDEMQLKFIKYMQEIVFGFSFGAQWEKAEVVEPIVQGQSLAGYVLGGSFRECCDKGCVLDDKTMCYINKDIHNRIYTLLINEYFN